MDFSFTFFVIVALPGPFSYPFFGVPIGLILASFVLKVPPILPTKFRVNGLSVHENKRKNDFQDGGHLRALTETILDIL